jgi:hypothetical protein
MLLDEIKSVVSNTDKKELYKFGLTMGIFLIIVAAFLYWRESPAYIYLFVPGSLFILTSLIRAQLLKYIFVGWMAFATVLGYIMTRVILTILFILFFAPVGIFLRLARKDLLKEKFNKNATSYWIKREYVPFDNSSVEKQY